ncbi:MAG: cytochrome c family protein, partial [Pirellulales bacterium]|nr:cytochrome c family protein [Pirellulales bacterium]
MIHFSDRSLESLPPPHRSSHPAPHPTPVNLAAANSAHAACFEGDPFPSAKKCQACHPGHYREWSVSPHAYAQLSPVFNAMSSKLIKLNNGTLGDFCIRCHTPVGMALDEPIVMSNMDRSPAAREGVTCVVCHRINQNWGRGAGRQALVAGGLESRIYGPTGNENLAKALADPSTYGALKTNSDPNVRARSVHREAVPFFALTTPATCGSCHDVFAPNGFRLEDAFSEFKASPAAREKHQNCQDCHMGQSPGVASGYAFEPVAKLGNRWTEPRKRTNHMMIGPDYSIIHPGLFPHNPAAVREEGSPADDVHERGLATMRQWLLFDYRSGWGTPEFENRLPENSQFPEPWQSQAMRFRARDLLNQQFELLAEADRQRHQVLSAGYKLGPIVLDSCDRNGL